MAARFTIVLEDEHCDAMRHFAHSLRNGARYDSIGHWHTERLLTPRQGIKVSKANRDEAHAIMSRVLLALASAAEHNVRGRPANRS